MRVLLGGAIGALSLLGRSTSPYRIGTTMMKSSISFQKGDAAREGRVLWQGKDEKDGDDLQIIRMNKEELGQFHYAWALKENWTPAKGSLEPVYALAPGERGFYALHKSGRTIATVSAMEYPKLNTVFVGFFICDKEFRGQGYGKKLWTHVVGGLQEQGYEVALDCLDHMLPVYQKLGFHKIGCDIVWKYVEEQKRELTALKQEFCSTHTLDVADQDALGAILAFDAQHLFDSPERKAFLEQWIRKEATQTIVAKDPEGNMIGYGVLSRRLTATQGEFGYRIGPLITTNENAGSLLIEALKARVGQEPVFMDTCESHGIATKLAQQGAFQIGAKLNRMSTTTQTEKTHQVPEAGVGLTSLAYSPF